MTLSPCSSRTSGRPRDGFRRLAAGSNAPPHVATVIGLAVGIGIAGDAWAHRTPPIPGTDAAGIEAKPSPIDDSVAANAARARDAVLDAVLGQLDRLSEGISTHEASRPRTRLLERRLTVETFLIAGLAPQQLVFGDAPDVAAPWRFAFDGTGRRLAPDSATTADWSPLGRDERAAAAIDGISGRFLISFLRPVGGDDPVTISGRFLARPDRVMLAATWCEPCLAPDSVDFPIAPEGFLLEWDDSWRTIRVRVPMPGHHAERTLAIEDVPPLLDQPDDLFDLFDGLRPLPWLLGDPVRTPEESPERGATTDIATPGPEHLDAHPDTAGHPTWISRTPDGGIAQRVTILHAGADSATLRVEQPPVRTTWTSFERYELVGDVHGEPLPTRSIRPQGSILAHDGGTVLTLSIELPEPSDPVSDPRRGAAAAPGVAPPTSPSAHAVVESGGRRIATLRWDRIRLLDRVGSDRLEASLRHAFEDPAIAPHATGRIDPLVALDPAAAARRRLRGELRDAIADGTGGQVRDRIASHLDRLANDGLDPTVGLRSIEMLEERLLGASIAEGVADRLATAWRAAFERSSSAALRRLLDDRIRQGRFGAARRLATALASADGAATRPSRARVAGSEWARDADRIEDRPDRDEGVLGFGFAARLGMSPKVAPAPTFENLPEIVRRIDAVIECEDRPAPSWHEPPGRRALEESNAGSRRPRADRSRVVSAQDGPRDADRGDDASMPPLVAMIHGIVDDAIATNGTSPRRGTRERLHEIVTTTIATPRNEPSSGAAWSDPGDRRRLATAMRIFIAERRHLLAAHLRSAPPPTETRSPPSSRFARALADCLERVRRLGPTDPALRRAGDREEQELLDATLRSGLRLADSQRLGPEIAQSLRSAIVAISDARRLRRASVCFPHLRRPIADAEDWHRSRIGEEPSIPEAIDRAVGNDAMLAAIAERIAIESRLIAADPSTAGFRTAMRSAQIDALAARLDAIAVETVQRLGGAAMALDHLDVEPVDLGRIETTQPPHDAPARATAPAETPMPAFEDARRFAEAVTWILDGGAAR